MTPVHSKPSLESILGRKKCCYFFLFCTNNTTSGSHDGGCTPWGEIDWSKEPITPWCKTSSMCRYASSFVILLILGIFFFHRQVRMARKSAKSNGNDGYTRPLTPTVRHRSLHGPIKLNVSVSGTVAVSVSVHIESCTIYFSFLDFYRSRFRILIRTNRMAPLVVRLISSCWTKRVLGRLVSLTVYFDTFYPAGQNMFSVS